VARSHSSKVAAERQDLPSYWIQGDLTLSSGCGEQQN
jgi:hypothetical protein